MDSTSVQVTTAGSVRVITLNRPDSRNAINEDLASGLLAALEELDSDPGVRVGILAGNGSGFCSGMDLKAFAANGLPKSLHPIYARRSKKPLIAAIEGFALAGGLELALVCDLLVAGHSAKFGVPEVKVGLFAAGGALIRLPRRLPHSVAMQMALTGDNFGAAELHHHGLINELVDDGKALDAALALAERIARNSPSSVIASKQVIGETGSVAEADAWELQRPLIRQIFRSADAKEGARAFGEKRRPIWSDPVV